MWDKTFTYLLVLFMLVGVLSYDLHIRLEGKMGIVSKIVDYVGIAQFDDLYQDSISNYSTSYKFDYKNIERLQENINLIGAQRTQLLEHRQEILDAIDQLEFDIYEEGQIYENVIFQERDKFFEDIHQVKEFGDRL